MNLTQSELVEFARSLLPPDEVPDVETRLFSSGLLDSIAMMSLINFVEQRAGVDVAAQDVTLENFDSLGRILAYLATHG
jgi:acyl carrier protein